MASQLIASQGKVKELRVVELGSRHGPPTDQIDVEVVAELDTVPDRGPGFPASGRRESACSSGHAGSVA